MKKRKYKYFWGKHEITKKEYDRYLGLIEKERKNEINTS